MSSSVSVAPPAPSPSPTTPLPPSISFPLPPSSSPSLPSSSSSSTSSSSSSSAPSLSSSIPPVSVSVSIRVKEGSNDDHDVDNETKNKAKQKKKNRDSKDHDDDTNSDTDDDDGHSWELMLNSVVKVFCTSTTPNYAQPWQMKRQETMTSSGFVIKSPLLKPLNGVRSVNTTSDSDSTTTTTNNNNNNNAAATSTSTMSAVSTSTTNAAVDTSPVSSLSASLSSSLTSSSPSPPSVTTTTTETTSTTSTTTSTTTTTRCSNMNEGPRARRILGNAHGVTNASSIRVRRHGDAKKYPATMEFISHESDLVLLDVSDPQFWEGLEPLELGDVPRLHDSVSVAGYPTGGDNLSVTKGVVSRVIVGTYSHSGENLLCVQIDAAINSGNSGGPAMQAKKVVGVAFETLTSAQNIGYIIPVPVIRHFLDDIVRHQRYTSFPRMSFMWQKFENDSMRKAFKMPEDKHGILILCVDPLESCATALQRNDILLSMDGVPIADDGTIFFRRGERLLFTYIPSTKFVGETCAVGVWRDGKELTLTFQLECRKPLVPLHLHDELPTYYVYAGLVLTVLSRAYLYHEWGKEWHKKGPVEFVEEAYYGVVKREQQQVVILSQVLVDDINNGYQFNNLRLNRVNGVVINNLRQVVDMIEAIEKIAGSFVRFDLDRESVVILDTTEARTSTPRILKQNNIGSDKSIDLLLPPSLARIITASTSSSSLPAATAAASFSPSLSISSSPAPVSTNELAASTSTSSAPTTAASATSSTAITNAA